MLYLSLEDTEWPWVALVCMQTVVLMPVGIAPPSLNQIPSSLPLSVPIYVIIIKSHYIAKIIIIYIVLYHFTL